MSVIVDSQLFSYQDHVGPFNKENYFIQKVPESSSVPIGSEKRLISTSSSQGFGNQLSFLLGQSDFVGNMYATVKLTYPSAVVGPKAPAMAVIKRVEVIGSTGNLMDYSYDVVSSHLGQARGAYFLRNMLENAGGETPASATVHEGCALLPMAWSSWVTQEPRHALLPAFLVNGPIEVRITLRSAAELEISGTAPSAVEVNLIYNSLMTIASLKQDLMALPSFILYLKDWQTSTNQAVTTSETNHDISQFQGTLRNLTLKSQQDSVIAAADFYTCNPITSYKINAGNQLIHQTFKAGKYEVQTDSLLLGAHDGSHTVPHDEVGTGTNTQSLVGPSESLDFSGGLNLRQVRSASVDVICEDASSTMSILGEVSCIYSFKNRSVQRFYN